MIHNFQLIIEQKKPTKKDKNKDFFYRFLITKNEADLATQISNNIKSNHNIKTCYFEESLLLLYRLKEKHSKDRSKGFFLTKKQYTYIFAECFYEGICSEKVYYIILPFLEGIFIETNTNKNGDFLYLSSKFSKNAQGYTKSYRLPQQLLQENQKSEIICYTIGKASVKTKLKNSMYSYINTNKEQNQLTSIDLAELNRVKKITLKHNYMQGIYSIQQKKMKELNTIKDEIEKEYQDKISKINVNEELNEIEKKIEIETLERKKNSRIYFDYKQEIQYLQSYIIKLQKICNNIFNGYYPFSKDTDGGNRLYSPFSNLDKGMNEYIIDKNNNKGFFSVDSKASQPSILYSFFRNNYSLSVFSNLGLRNQPKPIQIPTEELDKLKRVLEENDFYSFVGKELDRKVAKDGFMHMMFRDLTVNEKNKVILEEREEKIGYVARKDEIILEEFDDKVLVQKQVKLGAKKIYQFEKNFLYEFPCIYNTINSYKKFFNDLDDEKGYIIWSRILRNIESNNFISLIAPKLEKENILFFTKHDSINFFDEGDIPKVYKTVKEVLESSYQLNVQLHVEDAKGKDLLNSNQLFGNNKVSELRLSLGL